MSKEAVVLDIQNQEQVSTLTPADQNPTPMSCDHEIPIQKQVPTITPADENPTPTSSDDNIPLEPPLITKDNETRTSTDRLLMSRLQEEVSKDSRKGKFSKKIPKIQPIPPQMKFQQEKFEKDYYIPRAMTMGAIFESESREECSVLKLKLATLFIKNSGRSGDHLLRSIKEEIVDLSKCFDDQVLERFNSQCSLDVTLLLDGCSTLQFIYSRVWDELKELQINNGEASLIEQDLFLMDNQIPFRVLEILMDQVSSEDFSKNLLQISIDFFIKMNLMMPDNLLKGNYWDFYDEKRKPVHLLDILRSGLLYAFDAGIYFDNIPVQSSNYIRPRLKLQCMGYISEDQSSSDGSRRFKKESICKIHELLRSRRRFKREYFRNIQELKAAGIKLESSGTSCCLGDVTFTSFGRFRACLKLPPLIVNDSTGPKLWNLVAYEMCPENCNSDYGVTSYVSLLDSLIDNEEDVKELRSARILRNHLSSDKEVAKLFNEIGFNIASDQVYPEVKQKIQGHFDSCWATSIAQFLQEYFRNPWTFIALLGAMAVLALTVIQTYFAVIPPK